jgi:hypothetical protein
MIPVILESPYAGHVHRNKAYLQLCIRDCIARGEAAFASHQMYTGRRSGTRAVILTVTVTGGRSVWISTAKKSAQSTRRGSTSSSVQSASRTRRGSIRSATYGSRVRAAGG